MRRGRLLVFPRLLLHSGKYSLEQVPNRFSLSVIFFSGLGDLRSGPDSTTVIKSFQVRHHIDLLLEVHLKRSRIDSMFDLSFLRFTFGRRESKPPISCPHLRPKVFRKRTGGS